MNSIITYYVRNTQIDCSYKFLKNRQMGSHQTLKLLHIKRNYQQSKGDWEEITANHVLGKGFPIKHI